MSKKEQPEWRSPGEADKQPLLLFNSLTNSKTPLVSSSGRKFLTWYICGPTVYDSSHMGHARNYVSCDVIRRILEDYFNYTVFYVMNITDIDDKIILRARRKHLFDEYVAKNLVLSEKLLEDVEAAITQHRTKHTKKLLDLEKELDPSLTPETTVKRRSEAEGEKKLVTEWIEKINKLSDHTATLKSSLPTLSDEKKKEELNLILSAAQDSLAEWLDDKFGSQVEDKNVFKKHALKYETEFLEDMKALNVRPPDVLTRVSEYVPCIISFIEKIIENGYGYESGGSVYFDTQKFMEKNHFYAKLEPWSVGNAKLAAEGDGALASTKDKKKCSLDFALWKKSKDGEPKWESKWGLGRPGWHIECSAMAGELIGSKIDIHSGGEDLKFPHHDNELAQAEAFFECHQWVNYFLHTGHLHINGLKMSKSLKNFITIRQALTSFSEPLPEISLGIDEKKRFSKYTPRQVRLLFLVQQWDKVMNYSESIMTDTVLPKEKIVVNFLQTVNNALRDPDAEGAEQGWGDKEKNLNVAFQAQVAQVDACLRDNFNTSGALDAILEIIKETNAYIRGNEHRKRLLVNKIGLYVSKMLRIFGLVNENEIVSIGDNQNCGAVPVDKILAPYLDELCRFRNKVRELVSQKAEHSAFLRLCDDLRDEVMPNLGIKLEDSADYPWKRGEPEALKKEVADKKAKLLEGVKKKLEGKRAQLQKDVTKWTGAKEVVDFRHMTSKYSEFDQDGMPTKTVDNKPVSNSELKWLKKEKEKQDGLNEQYAKKLQEDPQFLDKLIAQLNEIEAQLKNS